MMRTRSIPLMVATLVLLGSGCSSSSDPAPATGGSQTGGTPVKGGTTSTGGTTQPGTGGTGSGGAGAGGQPSTGGAGSGGTNTGGSGGSTASGGAGTGGKAGTGGSASGGTTSTGGSASGGTTSTGGSASGGTSSTGGSASGGTSSTGGTGGSGGGPAGTGGTTSTGGSTGRDGGTDSGAVDGGSGAAVPSAGCGKASALKNNGYNKIGSRQYYLRLPANYDNNHAYRLILSLHGATGNAMQVAPGFWGIYDLSKGSTIFIAPEASGGLWSAASDTTFVGDIVKQVEADLCIDTSRIMLEGFSQGAAMSWTLACSLPKVFRAVVGHSGGGVANPKTCEPIAYFGSGGLKENVTQTTQSDQFARWNGCTIETFAKAPTGGHACNDYKNCSAGHPVRWCPFDGPHTPSPTDSGKTTSWMPSEVWPFFSQF